MHTNLRKICLIYCSFLDSVGNGYEGMEKLGSIYMESEFLGEIVKYFFKKMQSWHSAALLMFMEFALEYWQR